MTSDLEGEDVVSAAHTVVHPGLGVESGRAVALVLLGCHVVVGEGLLQWRDGVDGGHPSVQAAAVLSSLGSSPAAATAAVASARAPRGGGAGGGGGALVAGRAPGGGGLI